MSILVIALSLAHASLPDPLAAGFEGRPVCERLALTAQQRVLRCTFAPGVGHDRHFHAPHFGYALSGGRMAITDENGTRTVELATGSHYQSDGVAWHTVRNVGDTTVTYLIVEPLAAQTKTTGAFAWLTGRWCTRRGTSLLQEVWLTPIDGTTLGMGRTVRDGRVTGHETLRIALHDGAVTLFARPGNNDETAFRRTAGGDDWARFENPTHDAPTSIEYRRRGERLHARVATRGSVQLDLEYQPCDAVAGAP